MIAPLNAALLLIAFVPAPSKTDPALKVALLPLNANVPSAVIVPPLLAKVLAIVTVCPVSTWKVPVAPLVMVETAPPALLRLTVEE